MSVVDDYGRFDGRDEILRASLYPLKLETVGRADIGKWKTECSEAALVSCYTVDSKEYIEIERFNQRLRARCSKHPPPPYFADIRGHPHADAVKCLGVGDEVGDDPTTKRAREETSLPNPVQGKAPSEAQAIAYGAELRHRGADFSDAEVKAAWLSLEASKDDFGRWRWGKNQVGSDWRPALECRLGDSRKHSSKTSHAEKKVLPKSDWSKK